MALFFTGKLVSRNAFAKFLRKKTGLWITSRKDDVEIEEPKSSYEKETVEEAKKLFSVKEKNKKR